MALELNGTTGVSLVQDGVITDANLPAGSVLQVVSAVYTTAVTTTSETYSDTGLNALITPSSASSKVLIFVAQHLEVDANDSTSGAGLKLLRDSTGLIGGETNYEFYMQTGDSSRANMYGMLCRNYLDSPNTTSSVNYKTQFASFTNGESSLAQSNNQPSTIILMEIAG